MGACLATGCRSPDRPVQWNANAAAALPRSDSGAFDGNNSHNCSSRSLAWRRRLVWSRPLVWQTPAIGLPAGPTGLEQPGRCDSQARPADRQRRRLAGYPRMVPFPRPSLLCSIITVSYLSASSRVNSAFSSSSCVSACIAANMPSVPAGL